MLESIPQLDWQSVLYGTPMVAMLLLSLFRLEGVLSAPKPRFRGRRINGNSFNGQTLRCDPDGRPWPAPRRQPRFARDQIIVPASGSARARGTPTLDTISLRKFRQPRPGTTAGTALLPRNSTRIYHKIEEDARHPFLPENERPVRPPWGKKIVDLRPLWEYIHSSHP